MTRSEMSVEMTFVACHVCGMEIPQSGATAPEAVEYFVYFCGPECYERWTHEEQNANSNRNEQG